MKKPAKYQILYQELKRKIDQKEWDDNSAIPTEREISSQFAVSRSTVRQAIQKLTDDGYLYSAQGNGTFVMPTISRNSGSTLHSLSDDIRAKGETPGQSILEFATIVPSDFIRQKLSLADDLAKVLKVKRLRFAGTTPIGIQTAYIPIPTDAPQLNESDLQHDTSLYSLLKLKWDMSPLEAIETLSARLPSVNESKMLEIELNEVLLTSKRITLSSKLKPMEYCEMVYPTSRYDYTIRIDRKSFHRS